MNSQIVKRLMWKDFRTILPLFVLVIVGVIGVNVFCFFFQATGLVHADSRLGMLIFFGVGLPNLLSLAAGVTLVATEEDSGSLAWLRTLPANWLAIASSKLMVAFGVMLVAWALVGFCFLVQFQLLPEFAAQASAGDWPWGWTISANLAVSVTLLMCSFASAYLFRSPVMALLATIPMTWGSLYATWWLLSEVFANGNQNTHSFSERTTVPGFAIMLLSWSIPFALTLIAGFWLARRRLTGPDKSPIRIPGTNDAVDGFRPPLDSQFVAHGLDLSRPRPSITVALLWQNLRQSWFLLLVATISGLLATSFSLTWSSQNVLQFWAPLISGIAVYTLSGLPFFGDTVRSRCQFLSDRGVSPFTVWWTRIVPPLIALLLIALTFASFAAQSGVPSDRHVYTVLSIVGTFALGQFVSQWSARPILSFFTIPVVFYLVVLGLFPLIYYYGARLELLPPAIALMVPVFFFASYHLTPSWMRQQQGSKEYVWKSVGFLALGLVIPYVVVVGGRWFTTPRLDASWRSDLLSYQFPKRTDGTGRVAVLLGSQSEQPFQHSKESGFLRKKPSKAELELFGKELSSSTSIGEHVSLASVYAHMPYTVMIKNDGTFWGYPPPTLEQISLEVAESDITKEERDEVWIERDLRGASVLLHWANLLRAEAEFGDVALETLVSYAEETEKFVARILIDYIEGYGVDERVETLVNQFADPNRVMRSRILSMKAYWASIIRLEDTFHRIPDFSFQQDQPDISLKWPIWLAFERQRSVVPLDRQVRHALEFLETQYEGFRLAREAKPTSSEADFDFFSQEFTPVAKEMHAFLLRDHAVAELMAQFNAAKSEGEQ